MREISERVSPLRTMWNFWAFIFSVCSAVGCPAEYIVESSVSSALCTVKPFVEKLFGVAGSSCGGRLLRVPPVEDGTGRGFVPSSFGLRPGPVESQNIAAVTSTRPTSIPIFKSFGI